MRKLALTIAVIITVIIALVSFSPRFPARISYKPFQIFSQYPQTTVAIGGDVMLDRHIRSLAEKDGYDSLFKDIAGVFRGAGIGVINLEGPITSNASKTLLAGGKTTGDLNFTFDPDTTRSIAGAGIDAVSLANNHTDNFGRSGITETKKWLTEAGVGWFGDPANVGGTEAIQCDKHGFCVALVGYHEFQSGLDRILSDISRLSGLGYPVIVMPHWGDEYGTTSLPRVRQKAIRLIQAGAVAVIGSHPHVIQEVEWVNNAPVVYSLGNLIFDQYFSEDVMKGQIAELTLEKRNGKFFVKKLVLRTVSNEDKKGPKIVGRAIEFSR